ncbi:unnamed protein product [Zymoseptoria tritici ST99CH_1A5]|uniref:Mitochondrial carrier n=1 Tax=Zymoseptoria tritici ST99CH_1A5 TaxID=1276529 RepID=A0A1Y6LY61_ZYMTR|nr:unnamed protein product [Zymoseptoria tritici ST99CH_1A5]
MNSSGDGKSQAPAPTTSSSSSSPTSRSASSPPTAPTAATTSSQDASRPGSILSFNPSPEVQEMAKQYKTELAACSSSMVATTIAYPLDFVKSRMQGYQIDYKTAARDAYHKEGLRAFWRGVVPPTLSIALVRTFSFRMYQGTKYYLDQQFFEMNGRSPLILANTPGRLPTWDTIACHGIAGMAAGAFVTFLSCPFELMKLNAQLAGKVARDKAILEAKEKAGKYHTETKQAGKNNTTGHTIAKEPKIKTPGSLVLFSQQLKTGGYGRAYAGFQLHLARDILGTGVYFSTYETVKQTLNNFPGAGLNGGFAVPIAGGLCGMTSWAVIIPIDTAKTTYQKARLAVAKGVHVPMPHLHYFKRASYRGLGVSCMRSAVVNMIFFSIYESAKTSIDRFVGDELD